MINQKIKDNVDVRLNIRIPRYLQQFYKDRADDLSIPYTNLISLILYNYYADQTNKFVSNQIKDLLSVLEDKNNISSAEIILQIKEVLNRQVDYKAYDQFIF